LSVSIHALRSAIADWQQKPRMIKTMTEAMIRRFEFAVAILISFFLRVYGNLPFDERSDEPKLLYLFDFITGNDCLSR
jgi:hypothetical protein